jgi:hypothetical protein
MAKDDQNETDDDFSGMRSSVTNDEFGQESSLIVASLNTVMSLDDFTDSAIPIAILISPVFFVDS